MSKATSIDFGSHLKRIQGLAVDQWVGSDSLSFKPRRFREKRWSYMGIISEECISGTALVHLGYATSAFSFVYDRKQQKLIEKGYVVPPFSGMHFDRNPDQGDCSVESDGDRIDMLHRCQEGKRLLNINIQKGKRKQILANIEVEEDLKSEPLQLLTPMENGKRVFTQKIAGLSASGTIETQDATFHFDPSNSYAIFDWTNGFHNRVTEWNWASAGGLSNCGKRVGINFSSGVYNTGYLENVVWIDGKPELQSEIIFEYDSNNILEPWLVKSKDGRINLSFQPEQKRQSKDDFKLVASSFIQPCGYYSGTIQLESGETLQVSNLGGVVEEHYAKW